MNNYTKKTIAFSLVLTLGMHPAANAMDHLPRLNSKTALGTLAAAGAVATYYGANALHKKSLHWDWEHTDTSTINGRPISQLFAERSAALAATGEQWLWGAGTASHQVEGGCTNNWSEWTQQPDIAARGLVDAGIACDQWNRYKEDIQLAKRAGLNTYRFSIEWSKVMPTADSFDQSAIEHYKDVCRELVANGIKPVITLYHYSEPLWFYHAESFAKEENINSFVRFCQKMFEELHNDVHLWLTFNTPEGHAMPGWVYGDKPPGKKNQYQTAVEVMKNMLEAHVQVYKTLKSLPGGDRAKIGFLKNIFQLDPWDYCNPLDHLGCYIGHDLVDNAMYRFLRTGEYNAWIPGKASCKHTNEWVKAGNRCVDFIGLNYYCHGYMKNFKTIRDDKNEIPTLDKKYTIYGEGLHRALKELWDELGKPLNIPLYVTENGIGTDNDSHRTLFYQRYLYALGQALVDGIDVRGYITWSLLDNYEWGEYRKRYGLYHVNFETQERTLKPGAHYYVDLAQRSQQAHT